MYKIIIVYLKAFTSNIRKGTLLCCVVLDAGLVGFVLKMFWDFHTHQSPRSYTEWWRKAKRPMISWNALRMRTVNLVLSWHKAYTDSINHSSHPWWAVKHHRAHNRSNIEADDQLKITSGSSPFSQQQESDTTVVNTDSPKPDRWRFYKHNAFFLCTRLSHIHVKNHTSSHNADQKFYLCHI